MQTDPNGNLLSSTKLTSTVRRRRLAYMVELNLTPGSPGTVKDTTTWEDGSWLDITEDVESISGSMAIVPPYTSIMQIGSVPPASCQIVLRNVAKYSPNRTDSTLYTQLRMDSGSGGIYQLPVRVRVGFYDDPSLTPAASTTLASGMSAATYRQTDSASLSASKNAGCIIQVDSEQMVVQTTGTSVTVVRGFNGTTPAAHSGGATVSVLGAMTRQFAGVVHAFREGSRGRTITLTCFDRSYLLNQAKITSPSGATLITQDSTADTIIGQYLDALPASPVYLPVSSGRRSLDNGLYPVNFAWADDSSAWTEIAAVASADGGVAFFKKGGVLAFYNSQHYIGAASQYTFDNLNMGDLSIDYDYNAIFTETSATYSAQVIAPSQTIYAQSETMIVPAGTVGAAATTLNMGGGLSSSATAVTLTAAGGLANNDYIVIDQEQMLITAGGGTTSITVTRGQMGTTAAAHANGASVYKVTAGTYSTVIQFYSPTTSVTTPTQITSTTGTGDWQAVTGGGTLFTDGVTLTMTNYAQRASLTFTNKSAFYAAYITKFQLFGTPVQGFPARKVVQTKTTVPSAIAKRTMRIAPNFYWQDEAQTSGVVDMLADRWKTGRNIITLRDCPGVPQLELGDMVTVTEATALTSSVTGFVMRMAWDLGTGREPSYRMTLELADSTSFYQNSSYFVVGTDALGSTKKYYY